MDQRPDHSRERRCRVKTILITGASSGIGKRTAIAIARGGHRVYASMRDPDRDGPALVELARAERLALHVIALDVTSEPSVAEAIARVIREAQRLDVLIHNAGHMVFGPAEAFTPEQLAQLYDVNVIGTQRVNRAALPHLRALGNAQLIWVGSSSTRGGTPPFLAPYFAAKAGMDALAQSYAVELARFGIETTIVVPGAFTKGTSHFAHAGHPADAARAEAYWCGPYAGLDREILERLARLEPPDADVEAVARSIAALVALPHGQRPFRVHIDPSDDGSEVVNAVADRVRAQFYERIGFTDLLHPIR